jgi:hypothetical protein
MFFFTEMLSARPTGSDIWTIISALGTAASALLAVIGTIAALWIAYDGKKTRAKEIAADLRRADKEAKAKAASLALAVVEDMFWIESTLGEFLDFGLQEQNPAAELDASQLKLTDSMRSYMTRLHELGDMGAKVRALFALMIEMVKALDDRASLMNVDHPEARSRDTWINSAANLVREKARDIYEDLSPKLLSGW